MNKLSKILLTLATVLVIGLMAIALDKSSSKTIGDSNVPNLFASATNSSVAVSASTSTTIMSFNGNRQFASVCNNGANTVYLSFFYYYHSSKITKYLQSMGVRFR